MNYKLTLRRNLVTAKRIIRHPEKYDESLVDLAKKSVKSAEEHHQIYMDARPFKQATAAYEGSDNVISLHEVTT
jgi:hypothetical protein|tara:strand:- start:274 stop:495 length:222 start_codon:yes stop_codon:yes gene_type:complete